MDIFEFAIQMESDGQRFYQELANKADNKGIRNILKMLADDEAKHQRTIEQMRDGVSAMADTQILENAKNVFQQMKDFGEDLNIHCDAETLYRQAMDAEQKSISFYLDRADQEEDNAKSMIFKVMANEEKKHYRLLEAMVEFVVSPQTWLEDAEFSRLEEY